eukprot:5516998-Pleurochrysis_carterae.AAC.1
MLTRPCVSSASRHVFTCGTHDRETVRDEKFSTNMMRLPNVPTWTQLPKKRHLPVYSLNSFPPDRHRGRARPLTCSNVLPSSRLKGSKLPAGGSEPGRP